MPVVFYTNHYTNAGEKLSQRVLHRARRAAVHAEDSVAVSVQGEGYRGVPKELLDVLGMDVAREQRGASVPKNVEPDRLG
jgi:hypothetical protein